MVTTAPRKRKFADAAIATLLVGEAKVKFSVYQDNLCKASSFFRAALTSAFREGIEKEISLPEDEADIVDVFVDWLYYGQYKLPFTIDNSSGTLVLGSLEEPFKLVVFAEKYDIPDLKQLVFTKILEHAQSGRKYTLSSRRVEYVYQHTCRGSDVRKLVADWWTIFKHDQWYEDQESQDWLLTIPEFAIDLAVSLAKSSLLTGKQEYFLMKNSQSYIKDGASPTQGNEEAGKANRQS